MSSVMDQGRDNPQAAGLASSPYVIRFARRREAGFGTRQMPRCDRPHFPGRRIGDLRAPWRGFALLGIVVALALTIWVCFLST